MSAGDEAELPPNARVMLHAIRRALRSPAYAQSGDDYRAWRILLCVSEALCCAGVRGVASAASLRELRRVGRRNREIQRLYSGRNLDELATQYNLSSRQIRRIACAKSARRK